MNYLDKTGLTHLWDKIKAYVDNAVANAGTGSIDIADYIVERGTSGIWTWEKWQSGKAVCYGTYSGSITCNLAQGSLYYSAINGGNRINYPSGLFNSLPMENYSMHNSGVFCWLETGSRNTRTQTGMYRAIRHASSSTSYTIWIDFFVVGTWK